MTSEGVADELAGDIIREIFSHADEVAELNACLTSSRGDNFRLRLLQVMETPLGESAIDGLRVEAGINEYHRHLNRLLRLGLVRLQKVDGTRQYVRTELGERAVNALRQFERRAGAETARSVASAGLGTNSIRLFLRIYGDRREADWDHLRITYTPAEIGRLCLFLPRTIEGISAVDKLNEADLLVYKDDNQVHMQPLKARSFYQYLRHLYRITSSNESGIANWGEVPETDGHLSQLEN